MFETMTFDTALAECRSPDETEALAGRPLREATKTSLDAVCSLTGKPADRLYTRLSKCLGLKTLADADDHDLREGLRVLQSWLNDPTTAGQVPIPPRLQRPTGIGQLPVPRTKLALTDTSCGLCADPIKTGDLTGRLKPPNDKAKAKARLEKPHHQQMGWLCEHCLYQRREIPRRRDVLLRFFHHPFASRAVDLNAHECEVLRTWLNEDPATRDTAAWKTEPLDGTLQRLATSVTEGKGSTGISIPTTHTIVDVLVNVADPAATETPLLRAVAQHFKEWADNPERLAPRRFGTGIVYRREVLKRTQHPTVLSERGGPFDLHTAPPPGEEAPAEPAK